MTFAWRATCLAAALWLGGMAPARAQDMKVGEIYQGSLRLSTGLGGIVLPLPASDWKLISLDETRKAHVDYNIPMMGGGLVSLDFDQTRRQIKSLIAFSFASTDQVEGGWEIPPLCSDPEQYYTYKHDENRRRRQVRCWGVKLHAMKASAQVPPFFVGVTYFWSQGAKGLYVTYHFNPETDGFPPLNAADWSKQGITGDPKKAQYIEKLQAWGAAWQPNIERGFAGKPP